VSLKDDPLAELPRNEQQGPIGTVNLTEAEQAALLERRCGTKDNGTVFIRDFDHGVVFTLGGRIQPDNDGNNNYFVNVPHVDPPPGAPGIPVTFAYPEDVYEKHVLPTIIVRRDDISAAMNRWHPTNQQYMAPAPTAQLVTVNIPGVGPVSGPTKRVALRQAEPTDLLYTISILARHRQGVNSARREANEICRYVLARFNAYGPVFVFDSVGDQRTYECFREGLSMLDDLPDVAGRVIGFAISIRIEGELDLALPDEYRTVTELPQLGTNATIRIVQKEDE